MNLPPPAVVVTVYPSGSMTSTARAIRAPLDRLLAAAAPGDLAVCLHDPINGDERPVLAVPRALGVRLWCAWGANPLVGLAQQQGLTAAVQLTERWARAAADAGAEVVEPNGERNGRSPGHDWIIDRPSDRELLPVLAREMIAACRRGAPQAAVSFTTHDFPLWHPVPWRDLAGSEGVDLLALQYYAADERTPAPETHVEAQHRMERAKAQLHTLVARNVVRPDLGAGGSGWTPYFQIHGLTTAGVVAVGNAAPIVRAWALPERCDESGLRGLECLLAARARYGRSAGAIERAQAALGLVVDGIVGPKTLEAMGLAR